MKRPPGLWILLSAGVLCLSLQHVYGLKATELIFGKSSTTTSTTGASADGDTSKDSISTETAENSTTKSNLTGNPQLDYIYDPNLPRELNGYNLSNYPFYNGMPEDIDFKCDGLHDGFYASVPHKCQLYHHCLFGTRYDFLCANYTAFDQKTFICQFVSEVDCTNSHKFWHRNDALYQVATTTTAKPVPISISPALTVPRKPPPAARRRRPARRRPQYEYYDDDYDEEDRDDYYEEPPRRRRKRPRPRPRPVYDDYDDYEDDRHERRGTSRRNDDRRESPDRRKESHDRREYDDRRRYKDDRRRDYDDRTRIDEPDYKSERDKKKEDERKRKPMDVDDEENHRYESRRPDDTRYERPRGNRRPYDDNFYEDERRTNERPRASQDNNGQALVKPNSSSSIFNQPRMAPRIRPPVPKNEQSKFAYKSTTEASTKKSAKDDKYDDYDYELPPQRSQPKPKPEPDVRLERRPAKPNSERDNRRGSDSRSRPQAPAKPVYDFDDDEDDRVKPARPQMKPKQEIFSRDGKIGSRNRATTESFSVFDEDASGSRERNSNTKFKIIEQKSKNEERETMPATLPSPSTTKEPLREYSEVRIVKRPFLPSRGGNPFSARGLQPVGAKALDITHQDEGVATTEQSERTHSFAEATSDVHNGRQFPSETRPSSFESDERSDDRSLDQTPPQQDERRTNSESEEEEEEFKPSPVLVKVVNRLKYSTPVETESKEEFKPNRHVRPKPKEYNNTPRKNPLDISESEYDVTLNDALNPTLPNLPIRSFPTGFSAANDYSFDSYNRPRYDLNYNRPSEGRFQVRAPSQKIETIAEPFISTEGRKYVGIPSDPVYHRTNPQITQAQTHGFYTVY